MGVFISQDKLQNVVCIVVFESKICHFRKQCRRTAEDEDARKRPEQDWISCKVHKRGQDLTRSEPTIYTDAGSVFASVPPASFQQPNHLGLTAPCLSPLIFLQSESFTATYSSLIHSRHMAKIIYETSFLYAKILNVNY